MTFLSTIVMNEDIVDDLRLKCWDTTLLQNNNTFQRHPMIQFEETFNAWLYNALTASPIPSEVKAYCFNLNSPSGYEEEGIFGIELIGSPEYIPDDEDLACEEIWEPLERDLLIPLLYSTTNWEICLKKMHHLIELFLLSDNDASILLKQRDAVAIGFVDGNLDMIWVKKIR